MSRDKQTRDRGGESAAPAAGSAAGERAGSLEVLTPERVEPGEPDAEVAPDEGADVIDAAELDTDADAIDVESGAPGAAASGARGVKPTAAPAPLETTSALSAYMAELRHHAPISREEEHELAVRWVEEGDVDAARKLVLSNLRLVVKIAMEYRRAWTNTLDLIQEGNVGLMEAVQRYDPYQGVKLSSYGVYWVRAYILKYILDNMRSVRLGTTRASRKLFFRLNKEKRELERLGYEVEPQLLAERLDVSEDEVVRMEGQLSRPDLSMDAPLRRDEPGTTVGDTFQSAGTSAESAVGDREMLSLFRQTIDVFAEDLAERDREILDRRVLAEDPVTLAELGEEFGVSRERVRQLEARLVDRLREFMKSRMVDFEYYAPESDDED